MSPLSFQIILQLKVTLFRLEVFSTVALFVRVRSWYDLGSRHAVQCLLVSYNHVSGFVASRLLGLAKSRTFL